MKRLWQAAVVLPLIGITLGIGSPIAHAAETPLVISTTNIDFGNVNVGSTTGLELSVLIINLSVESFGPLYVYGGAPSGPEFVANSNCNGVTLAPGGGCYFFYTFKPTAPGIRTATSTFILSPTIFKADGETFSVSLAGNGVNPITAAPLSHAFGNVNVGTTSAQMITVITNTSAQSFGPLNIIGGEPPGPEFNSAQDCQGTTLAPGGTCSMYYTFTPTAPGTLTATSTFVISATPSPTDGETFTVSLSACGVEPGQPCPPAATSTTLESSLNPSVFGQQVTVTATVNAPTTPALPAGSVTFVDTTAGTTLATVTLDPNGHATLTTAALAVGSHAIEATYTPSSAAFAASSGSLTQVVKPVATSGGEPGLPDTGPSLPITLIWQGALIIAIGVALLMLARPRTARAIASWRTRGNRQAPPTDGANDRV